MGRIELIIGCMYSGKTTELIRQINRFQTLQKKMFIITHCLDTRYDEMGMICSHDNKKLKGNSFSKLIDSLTNTELLNAEIIFIEEGHFFPDLSKIVLYLANSLNKTIIISGLDGDFEGKPFEEIIQLIPNCEKLIKLNALCKKCNNGMEAIFSKRIIDSKEKQLVGSEGIYEAVCRKHFYN